MQLTSSQKMRDADNRSIHVSGVPSTLLMTNAAVHITDAALRLMGVNKNAVAICGSGDNGGDGIAAAINLMRRGVQVRCLLVGKRDKMSTDSVEMERRLNEVHGILEDFDPENESHKRSIENAGVIIDAIFGIGLKRELRGKHAAAVELINASPAKVVSADIASGVHADTGRIMGSAVKADITVTFSMAKPGHFVEPGCVNCGELRVCDVGAPAEALKGAGENIFALCAGELSLPKRPRISHKGDYGRLLIVGGSVGYSGAPAMCAQAASRSGTGMVFLGVPKTIYNITAARLWEPMPFPLSDDESGKIDAVALPQILDTLNTSDVCVIGGGLGRSQDLSWLVRTLLKTSTKPLIVDADGLFALGDDPETIKSAGHVPILTPHEGEFIRLGGKLTGDRIGDARSFASSRNCILVLKGHRTICAFPDGDAFIIAAGNPGMAKGGSGDVLAGIMGAMVCRFPEKHAVTTACLIHALAGDLCAQRKGEYAMLPTDVIDELPNIMLKMERGK